MRRAKSPWWLALLVAVVGAGMPPAGFAAPAAPASDPVAAPRVLPFDTAHSRVGFRLQTRWGKQLRGEFPGYEGEVRVYPDGRRDVRVRLDSTRMRIVGHQRYTR